MSSVQVLRMSVTATAVGAVLWIGGCQHEALVAPDQVVTAKSTNAGGGGGDKDPTVDSVFPDSALQDTTLDVEVSGSNFDGGSQVSFEQGGVAAEKVRVNSTTFVNPKKVLANVTVQADADTGLYDVAVTTSTGRKGVGVEMFEVIERLEATIEDSDTAGILSDGGGVYLDVTLTEYLNLDATASSPRQLCFNFHDQLSAEAVGFSDELHSDVHCDDGYVTTGVSTFQEDNVTPGVPLDEMAVGSVQRARFGGVYVRDGYNWGFKYGRDCDLVDIPDERAVITRVSETEWTIEAMTMTLCKSAVQGRPTRNPLVASELHMPVKITVRLVTL